DLNTGAPVANANITLVAANASAKADKDGLAAIGNPSDDGNDILLASNGADEVFVPNIYWSRWSRGASQYLWYVINDRNLYRPGEEVHIKGWVRQMDLGKGGDVGLANDRFTELSYIVRDPQGNELHKG